MATNAPRVLLRSEQSGGEVAVIEASTQPPGFAGPPPHPRLRRGVLRAGGRAHLSPSHELFTRKAGELVFAPRRVPHTFANPSGAEARALIVCTPAGFERYLARMAAERDGVGPPEWAEQPIPEVTVVGPQIDRQSPP